MREITHDELKQIQLGILDKVHDFCEKNGITYFLSSGTLIGAVRHKGYIPWDDDLDIYMPRPDYNKFIKLFSQNPPENTEVLSLETSKTYQYPFAKVVDTRTEMVESAYGEKFKIGVYMDVFPLESTPNSILRFALWFFFLSLLRQLYDIVLITSIQKERWCRSGGKRIVKYILYPFFRIFPYRVLLEGYDRVVRKYNSQSKYVYNMSGGIGFRGGFRRSAIAASVDIEFEGRKYKTMRGYKEYLYVTYGDFMQLPPPEKRVSNHSFVAWWREGV